MHFLPVVLFFLVGEALGHTQAAYQTLSFGPIYNTDQSLNFTDYNPSAYGGTPLTSVYVYLTSYVTANGTFIGNGGTPSMTVTEGVGANNLPSNLNETISASFTESSPLASNSTEHFAFSGSTVTVLEVVTQNTANYTGNGIFTIDVNAHVVSANVTGGSYDQNSSSFPVYGTVTVSYNGPLPVPEVSRWGFILAGLLFLWAGRRVFRTGRLPFLLTH